MKKLNEVLINIPEVISGNLKCSVASIHKIKHDENYEKLIGVAGPYDAYSLHYNWVTPRYLAIDQGTIAPMIENQKSAFLWNLFMNAPDVRSGLVKLGFHSTQHGF